MPSNLSKDSTSRVATAIRKWLADSPRASPLAVHTIPLERVLQPVELKIRGILQQLAERLRNSLCGASHNRRSSLIGRGRLRRRRRETDLGEQTLNLLEPFADARCVVAAAGEVVKGDGQKGLHGGAASLAGE